MQSLKNYLLAAFGLIILMGALTVTNTRSGQAQGSNLVARVDKLEQDVTALQTALNNEIAARQAADTTLQNNLNAETAARQQGDTDTLASAKTYTDQQVANEAAARQAADTTLQ